MAKNFALKSRPPRATAVYNATRRAIATSHRQIVKAAANNRAGVTETWNHKYKFVGEVETPSGHIVATVRVEGPSADSNDKTVWTLLSEGTKVRRVALSSDYKRATNPGQFFSKKKQGTISVDGIRRPGIDARDWDKIQNEETLEELRLETPKAVQGVLRTL